MPPPDRWDDYSPVGLVIEGTRILCCKVPLKYGLVCKLPEEEQFTPEELIKRVSAQGFALGLVVDLTFTRKYYNSDEFTRRDVQYAKIFTKGHEVPSDEVFSRFADTLNNFLAENNDNTTVAVHCTHGVNRTGYLVCRYLIETCDMSPDDAINAFNTARGHNVERVNYLEDLRTRIPGEVTVYEPGASDEDKQLASPGPSRFPRPGAKVENSYSKLKEQHASFPGHRQRDRDYEMRNRRGHSPRRNQERNFDNWQRREVEGHRGRWNNHNRDNYSNENFRDNRNRYSDQRGHHSRQSYHDDQRGHYDNRNGHYDNHRDEYRSYGQGHQGHYANGGGRYGRDNYSEDRKGQNYGGSRGGGRGGYRYGGNRGHQNGWDRAGPSDYSSPMRYTDWSDNSSRYANSGWSSGGQDRRANHRGGRGRR